MVETKRASWGGLLERRRCIRCGEWVWFTAGRAACNECEDDEESFPLGHDAGVASEKQYTGSNR